MTATRATHIRGSRLTDRLADSLKRSAPGRVAKALGSRAVPTHWSFMFAEVALYSFVIVLLTGLFLMFFFDPSGTVVSYGGSYGPPSGIASLRAADSPLYRPF